MKGAHAGHVLLVLLENDSQYSVYNRVKALCMLQFNSLPPVHPHRCQIRQTGLVSIVLLTL